jgi:hypothetical protein
MNCGRRWRRLGARASRPPARRRRAHAIQTIRTPSPTLPHQDAPHFAPCGSIAGRLRATIAIAGDRHELRSTLAPPGSAGVSPTCSLTGGSKSASGRPTSPFAPCGSRGPGGRGATMRGNTERCSSLPKTLPVRAGGMRSNRAPQQRNHRLRRASSRMACRLRISATSYLVGIEPAIGRIFTIAGNCPERP